MFESILHRLTNQPVANQLETIFRRLFLAYITALFLEALLPGFVTNYLSLSMFLWFSVAAGVAVVIDGERRHHRQFRILGRWSVAYTALCLGFVVWQHAETLGRLAPFAGLAAAVALYVGLQASARASTD